MTVTNLHEAEFALCGGRQCGFARAIKRVRLQYSTLHNTERAGSRPGHALKKSAAVDAIMVVIVKNLVFGFRHHRSSQSRSRSVSSASCVVAFDERSGAS